MEREQAKAAADYSRCRRTVGCQNRVGESRPCHPPPSCARAKFCRRSTPFRSRSNGSNTKEVLVHRGDSKDQTIVLSWRQNLRKISSMLFSFTHKIVLVWLAHLIAKDRAEDVGARRPCRSFRFLLGRQGAGPRAPPLPCIKHMQANFLCILLHCLSGLQNVGLSP
jgi:hypothetical protein